MTSAELENLVRSGQLKREPGLPPATWRVLSKGHEARNMAEYEGAVDVDERLVDDLIKAAEAVRLALRAADLPPDAR